MQTQTVETTTESVTQELDNQAPLAESENNSSDDTVLAVEEAVDPVPVESEPLATGAVEVLVGVVILTVAAIATAMLLRKN